MKRIFDIGEYPELKKEWYMLWNILHKAARNSTYNISKETYKVRARRLNDWLYNDAQMEMTTLKNEFNNRIFDDETLTSGLKELRKTRKNKRTLKRRRRKRLMKKN